MRQLPVPAFPHCDTVMDPTFWNLRLKQTPLPCVSFGLGVLSQHRQRLIHLGSCVCCTRQVLRMVFETPHTGTPFRCDECATQPFMKKCTAAVPFLGPSSFGLPASFWYELMCFSRWAAFLWYCCSSTKVGHRVWEGQEDHSVASAVV